MKYVLLLLLGVGSVFGAVDINNATQKELRTLNGIGIKKAEAIVTYRKEHCFKRVEDLSAVRGIGKKFIAKHKDALEVGNCHR